MAVIHMQVEFFKTHRKQMHHITNVQVENPVILVFYSKNRLHVILKSQHLNFALRTAIT